MAISERVRKAKGNIITTKDEPSNFLEDINYYYEIAKSVGLTENRRNTLRYVSFMQERFPERFGVDKDYASVWARAFRDKKEYDVADDESLKVLQEVDERLLEDEGRFIGEEENIRYEDEDEDEDEE